MSTSKRTSLRVVGVLGAVVVVGALGAVTFNASASERPIAARTIPAPAFDDDIDCDDPLDDEEEDFCDGVDGITPPTGARKLFSADVEDGVQKYTCTRGTFNVDAVPDADLVSDDDEEITHFKGPSWESDEDGSIVTARKAGSERSQAGAIDELLLQVTAHKGPRGLMSNVRFIQRVETEGGVAPRGRCTHGTVKAVPYEATYIFYS